MVLQGDAENILNEMHEENGNEINSQNQKETAEVSWTYNEDRRLGKKTLTIHSKTKRDKGKQ